MKLLRFGEPGREKPGLELDDGTRVDVSNHISDYTPDFFAHGGLERLRALSSGVGEMPRVDGAVRLGPPTARPHKFIAIGLNFRRHAEEAGLPIPAEPIIFTKYTTCIVGPNDDVVVPPGSTKLDYEVELALVIKNKVRHLASESEALEHVAGYLICNDVSERAWQIERGGQWVKGKSADTFGPLGPWLVTADAVPEPGNLAMRLSVNGETRQESNTRDMIFAVPHLVWYLSQFFTLEPGDVITTGTPQGVGMGHKPPRWLNPGDTIALSVAGLGTQTQRVRGT